MTRKQITSSILRVSSHNSSLAPSSPPLPSPNPDCSCQPDSRKRLPSPRTKNHKIHIPLRNLQKNRTKVSMKSIILEIYLYLC